MRKTIGRDLPNGDYIEIEAELRDGSDGLSPGFAIICMGWEKAGQWSARACKRNGRDATYGGAAHEVILEVAPELAPIVKVHLARPDGMPMHGLVNGWYFYSGKAAAYEREEIEAGRNYGYSRLLETSDHDRAARALHVDPADLPAGLDHGQFTLFAASLGSYWHDQSMAARAALVGMVDGDGVEDSRG